MKVRLLPDFRKQFVGACRLSFARAYVVHGIEADDYRIVDESGEPVLLPSELFDIVDSFQPDDWVRCIGDEGEVYAYPAELNRIGFFEDYFDGDPDTMRVFQDYLKKHRSPT